ncbi:MAG: hypothetical protein ACOYB1_05540 [Limnohabitans sp.]
MFHAPRDIYGPNLLSAFVHELGGAKPVAKFLHVTERTIRRWLEKGKVPRAAVLALYWETQYGRSQIFTNQVNEIRLLYRRVCILQDQYERAKDIVIGLRKLHAGTANEPFFDDLSTFSKLPPDTYGAMTQSSADLENFWIAKSENAHTSMTLQSTKNARSRKKAILDSTKHVRKAYAR